jgi:hypothetical protein
MTAWDVVTLSAAGDGVLPSALLSVCKKQHVQAQVPRRACDRIAAAKCLHAGTPLTAVGCCCPQLVFNAPEGLARLCLEHGVRPRLALRAVLITDLSPAAVVGPSACSSACQRGRRSLHAARWWQSACEAGTCTPCTQGGLGGMLLRLRKDGHGAVKVVGPPGVWKEGACTRRRNHVPTGGRSDRGLCITRHDSFQLRPA